MNFPIPSHLNFQQYYVEKYGSKANLIDKAKNGDITAQADLGFAYSEGSGDLLGIAKDNDKAIGWLNCAVEKGYELPSILGKLGELLDRKGTLPCQRKAHEMYHRAAKLGCTSSQLNLAEMYRCGVEGVVNEDLKEAFKWFKIAADEDATGHGVEDLGEFGRLFAGTMKKLGDTVGGTKLRALTSLYKYYLEGDCPEGRPQPAKAVHYLTRAAELGDTEAQLVLGQIYLNGSCEQNKDIERARRWLGKASASGDVRANQLLQQCEQFADSKHVDASERSGEAVQQTFDILTEKLTQRFEANTHPFAISQPVLFSEEMLSTFDQSPTARIYLQAFKLVKEGFEILHKSNFTNARGISLIARGYLTENSILQAFPLEHCLLSKIFQLCEKNLQNNPNFFEGLLLSFAFAGFERKISWESSKVDLKKVMCIKNLIHLIQDSEHHSIPPEDSFKFDENYSSWLHVLYYLLAAIYTIADASEKAAEAFENSLKCCPSYFESKRGFGYSLMSLYVCKMDTERNDSSQNDVPPEWLPNQQTAKDREISKYASWTSQELGDAAEKILKEYLAEASPCYKTYPNVCYYLANIAFVRKKMKEFKKYYELGQDAEEKRLPFFDPVDIELKDWLSSAYQLSANEPEPVRCGNKACIKKVKESELKSCSGCGNQKYCGKDCQRTDWKNHKATCKASKGQKAKGGS